MVEVVGRKAHASTCLRRSIGTTKVAADLASVISCPRERCSLFMFARLISLQEIWEGREIVRHCPLRFHGVQKPVGGGCNR